MDRNKEFILWFDQISINDVPLVGGKNASLGEMYRELSGVGINVPNGFAITAHSYRYVLEKAGVMEKIKKTLKDIDTKDMEDLKEKGHAVRNIILNIEFPEEIKKPIIEAYRNLCGAYFNDKRDIDVAVRSSATAEDLADASFAGQQETYLNVKGEAQLLQACKRCLASLFTNRAISYREEKGFDHFSAALSIGIQKMVRSDLASSGVMFSIDTETGFRNVVFITAGYGLGENIVQGAINPDEYYVFKPTLKQGYNSIISKNPGSKEIKMVYDQSGSKHTKNVKVELKDRKRFVLDEEKIIKLAKWACIIEDHYSWKKGRYMPMDIEWAEDGKTGELFIVQARPETVQSQKNKAILEEYILKEKGNVLSKGKSVGQKIGKGKANVIKDVHNIDKFNENEILVTEMTDPDWEPIMKKAAAIVTNRGGRTCHAAIISRELGIPCVVGTEDATDVIKKGNEITVSCAEGEEGFVYKGLLDFEVKKYNLESIPKTKTKIMINIGNPEEAFELSFLPNSGVGLAREEFIINSYIKIHPKALLDFENIKDKKAKKKIEKLTYSYEDKTLFFIDKLAQGIGMIAAAFYPKDVIVRLSDFKSNEYANLIGGKEFEPEEDNPMIGWRGASRYYNEKYKEAFALECRALKKVREEFGLNNVKVMVPFCRTTKEGKKVLREMEKNGLRQGEKGLEVYVMCEIPSNVLLGEEFSEIFDGFSIGTNDLTQLTLGLDRDSELVSDIFDERNDAVKNMVRKIINTAHRNNRKVGICGDAPSTFKEFAQFLVECGIDSISLSPDAVIRTTLSIAEEEKKLSGG
ncbi:phosphoenolpyruvate synthase [Candidatus Woesearchaeota archaeon]|nr:phosphoenolpyruvate synthase [Candidatus Woesearchaeota archaeon]